MASIDYANERSGIRSWIMDKIFMGKSIGEYIKAQITLFNFVASIILMLGGAVTVWRFATGLSTTTNLSYNNPWGLWIGFDVMSGVALAAGGYTVAAAVYIFRLEDYHPIVRPAILTGFLGYLFVGIGLMYDLGRPWRLPYPMIRSFGMTSVMFSVGWHLCLYLICLILEFVPAVFEWLGLKKFRNLIMKAMLTITVAGIMLSTLHQAALGGLMLLMPGKLHPYWYSILLPLLFFVSSIFAGLAMTVVESALSHRVFVDQVGGPVHKRHLDRMTVGLGKAAAVVMFMYLGLKMMAFMHADQPQLLTTPLGLWYLLEVLGFVLAPCLLFVWGARTRNTLMIRLTAFWTVIGVILNRINVSIIAFNWQEVDRYVPKWSEYVVSIFIVTVGILVFRWIVNRMPILRDHPDYPSGH